MANITIGDAWGSRYRAFYADARISCVGGIRCVVAGGWDEEWVERVFPADNPVVVTHEVPARVWRCAHIQRDADIDIVLTPCGSSVGGVIDPRIDG